MVDNPAWLSLGLLGVSFALILVSFRRPPAPSECAQAFMKEGAEPALIMPLRADTLIVYAKTAAEKGPHGITAFLIEKGMQASGMAGWREAEPVAGYRDHVQGWAWQRPFGVSLTICLKSVSHCFNHSIILRWGSIPPCLPPNCSSLDWNNTPTALAPGLSSLPASFWRCYRGRHICPSLPPLLLRVLFCMNQPAHCVQQVSSAH